MPDKERDSLSIRAYAAEWLDVKSTIKPRTRNHFESLLRLHMDYLHTEWEYKPVGFVSYGGVSAGARSVQMLNEVATT